MKIIFTPKDSQNALREYLSQREPYILIGSDTEAPVGYYACCICGVVSLHIGIIVNQSTVPIGLLIDSSACFLIGYDASVSIVDGREQRFRRTVALDGAFFEFLIVDKRQWVIVVHETGVVVLSMQGDEIGRYVAKDIVENWSLADDCLILTIMDSPSPITLSLDTFAGKSAVY